MDAELQRQKKSWRLVMRRRLAELSDAERAENSRQLLRRIIESPAWMAATKVLLYAPLPTEPDLDLLWQNGALAAKQVAYPRTDGTGMRLYFVTGLDELEPTRWGLREPPMHAARETILEEIDLALVPGVAFDAAGRRLGRGGGFYDRLLAQRVPTRTHVIGVCFACQHVAEPIPSAAHDMKVDEVYTD